jgi:hypothetical protein
MVEPQSYADLFVSNTNGTLSIHSVDFANYENILLESLNEIPNNKYILFEWIVKVHNFVKRFDLYFDIGNSQLNNWLNSFENRISVENKLLFNDVVKHIVFLAIYYHVSRNKNEFKNTYIDIFEEIFSSNGFNYTLNEKHLLINSNIPFNTITCNTILRLSNLYFNNSHIDEAFVVTHISNFLNFAYDKYEMTQEINKDICQEVPYIHSLYIDINNEFNGDLNIIYASFINDVKIKVMISSNLLNETIMRKTITYYVLYFILERMNCEMFLFNLTINDKSINNLITNILNMFYKPLVAKLYSQYSIK